MDQSSDLVLHFKTTQFSSLSYAEKCAVKGKRPTPQLDIVQSDRYQTRKFNLHWYGQYLWLTGSVITGKMYCYVCLLFGGDNREWCESGIGTIKNFHRRARKHQTSKRHIDNWERYHLLGKLRISAFDDIEMVSRNRRYLDSLIQVISFYESKNLRLSYDEREICQ